MLTPDFFVSESAPDASGPVTKSQQQSLQHPINPTKRHKAFFFEQSFMVRII